MVVCSVERNKCRQVSPWPEKRRKPRPMITRQVLRHNSYLMSNDGCGRLSAKWRSVKLTMQVPVKRSVITLLTSFVITTATSFLEKILFLLNVRCSVMTVSVKRTTSVSYSPCFLPLNEWNYVKILCKSRCSFPVINDVLVNIEKGLPVVIFLSSITDWMENFQHGYL